MGTRVEVDVDGVAYGGFNGIWVVDQAGLASVDVEGLGVGEAGESTEAQEGVAAHVEYGRREVLNVLGYRIRSVMVEVTRRGMGRVGDIYLLS